MTAAEKSQSKRNLFDRELRLVDQQIARPEQPPVHHIGVRRTRHTLTERAFEMPCANTGQRSQLAQRNWLTERVLNIFENELEPAAWKTAYGSRRSWGQVGIAVNQMVGEEFATTLHIEPSGRRATGGFSRQTQRNGLDDGISN